MRRHLPAAALLFTVAFLVRWWFLSGLVLGDDAQEFSVIQRVLTGGPNLHEQLQLRFAGWGLNWLFAYLFGLSETTILLPTWILSSTFGILAYALLVPGYGSGRAFVAGLAVATAPFEVVLGTVRTNDLYLAWTLALGFVLLVRLEHRPVLQGVLVALCLWLGFYVKLWAVYALPGLALYYAAGRRWRGAVAFAIASVVVHGATCAYWWWTLGTPIPFIESHAANYPVAMGDLGRELAHYPRMLFVGSEFGTTLFGIVPYLLVVLLATKALSRASGRFDRLDALLAGFYGSFFLLLEFFPNGFSLDAYYTVPRIFRYLAPLSFPMATHVAKLLLDRTRDDRPVGVTAIFVPLVALNLVGAANATGPGRVYREALFRVVHAIERAAPPKIVADTTVGYWLRMLVLDPEEVRTEVANPEGIYGAKDCEAWLRDQQPSFPAGTLLVTGLSGYVHYGAHRDGFRLTLFETPLDPGWELVGDYGLLTYLPQPEPARLWRWKNSPAVVTGELRAEDVSSLAGITDPNVLWTDGMARYDRKDYPGARPYFRKLMREYPGKAEDAMFFYAASFFRESKWMRAQREFKRLIGRFPKGRWTAGAQWHVAVCDLRMGHVARARARLEWILRRYPNDQGTVQLARDELDRLRRRRGGVLLDLWERLVGRS